MCLGFSCKNNYFPISILTKILLHDNDQETTKECKHYSIVVTDDRAELSKLSFNNEVDEVNNICYIKYSLLQKIIFCIIINIIFLII